MEAMVPLEPQLLTFEATKSSGSVSALLTMPEKVSCLLIFAHGAGADMRHWFMEKMSGSLAARGIATLRFQFPYAERRSRRPDPQAILIGTIRSAVGFAGRIGEGFPLFAGGKSLGGRMTSLAASEAPLSRIRGIVFFGFPLHQAGKPSMERAGHLSMVEVPMLFLQGTRDALADLSLVKLVCGGLGNRATLAIFDDADHSFKLRPKAQTPADIFSDLASTVQAWCARSE